MRPIVQSNKHYVQVSLATVTAGAINNIVIAAATDAPASGDADAVQTGSIIKAVYIEMWIRAQSTSPGSTLVSFYKLPGAGVAMTAAQSAALHTYDNKKNVLYHTQGLTNDQDADAIPFIRQWFKIPKGKQRMGLDDNLILGIHAQAIDNTICGFATYKEYS